MRPLIAAAALAAVASLAACGTATIKPGGAAKAVVDVVRRQTGFRPTDVHCPSGVEAIVGRTFDCHFTGPEPRPYTASVRITRVHGQRVIFYVSTRPGR
jgi:hypothetical protein